MAAPLTVEQLIGLNREIAALVRAGVPLEQGLRQAAEGNQEADSRLARRLSERLDRGATLSEALAAEGDAVPSAYQAIVTAGQKSGRLPEALEAVAGLAEEMLDLRRRMRLAAIYPLFVGMLAYGLFTFFLVYLLPKFQEMAVSMRLPPGRILSLLDWLRSGIGIWGPAIPLLVVIALIVSWLWYGRNLYGIFGDAAGCFRWLPGVNRIRGNLQRGWFCQLLSALVEHDVPLPEALELAGAAIGGGTLQQSSQRLANELRTGRPLDIGLRETPEFSPLVRWMMTAGESGSDLVTALRRGADLLLARARRQSDLFQSLTPILAIVVIGGGAALVYGLTVFGPLVELLDRLTIEPFV